MFLLRCRNINSNNWLINLTKNTVNKNVCKHNPPTQTHTNQRESASKRIRFSLPFSHERKRETKYLPMYPSTLPLKRKREIEVDGNDKRLKGRRVLYVSTSNSGISQRHSLYETTHEAENPLNYATKHCARDEKKGVRGNDNHERFVRKKKTIPQRRSTFFLQNFRTLR